MARFPAKTGGARSAAPARARARRAPTCCGDQQGSQQRQPSPITHLGDARAPRACWRACPAPAPAPAPVRRSAFAGVRGSAGPALGAARGTLGAPGGGAAAWRMRGRSEERIKGPPAGKPRGRARPAAHRGARAAGACVDLAARGWRSCAMRLPRAPPPRGPARAQVGCSRCAHARGAPGRAAGPSHAGAHPPCAPGRWRRGDPPPRKPGGPPRAPARRQAASPDPESPPDDAPPGGGLTRPLGRAPR
jgi:hypothetical protein